MLNYIRERQDARAGTPGRRIYDYATGAVILAVVALVIAGLDLYGFRGRPSPRPAFWTPS